MLKCVNWRVGLDSKSPLQKYNAVEFHDDNDRFFFAVFSLWIMLG
jgi:hypothetical protein